MARRRPRGPADAAAGPGYHVTVAAIRDSSPTLTVPIPGPAAGPAPGPGLSRLAQAGILLVYRPEPRIPVS